MASEAVAPPQELSSAEFAERQIQEYRRAFPYPCRLLREGGKVHAAVHVEGGPYTVPGFRLACSQAVVLSPLSDPARSRWKLIAPQGVVSCQMCAVSHVRRGLRISFDPRPFLRRDRHGEVVSAGP